ncbi:hypothetical protein B0H67DRAFT_647675 [Lasiosphaeris hirsuta]|uniref:NTF2-related export protein n=1 Tax=Lasiosphaeris hirsuta TaxID=260670 RepID=A0AA40A1H2_9PEZI|nr:hypothetical protein B0H67DRAFT_647675 [Lasiosphaeris hirsuta]
MAAADFENIASESNPYRQTEAFDAQFVSHYYTTFDADRKTLGNLYREGSMLTFESAPSLGAAQIVDKLANLPFQKVTHQVTTLDAQPSPNGIFILVTGQLKVDDSELPLNYSQAFQLTQDAGGAWFVQNDVFKLNLA